MEGDRGAGELGTGEGGKRELSEGAESGSRNQKGTRLLLLHIIQFYYWLTSTVA